MMAVHETDFRIPNTRTNLLCFQIWKQKQSIDALYDEISELSLIFVLERVKADSQNIEMWEIIQNDAM